MSFWANRSVFAKIVTVLAIAFVLGIGLCGVDAVFLASLRNLHEEFGPNTFVGGIGAIAVVFSGLGLAGTTVAWVVVRLVASFSYKDSESQQLFDHPDDPDKKD